MTRFLSAPPSSAGGSPAISMARSRASAFTMIEIALSLAIIAFALVTVIGVLPIGMNVQKENREDTIINQDAAYWMETLRGGARGLDDLTNYVAAITITATDFDAPNMVAGLGPITNNYVNPTLLTEFSVPNPSPFELINGQRIVGLLGTPKYQLLNPTQIRSNHVVAYVHALSGSAVEKFPQTNQAVWETAFKYRLTSEIVTCVTNSLYYATNSPASGPCPANGPLPEDKRAWTNYWLVNKTLLTNLHDLRLTFRWPLRPDGNVGSGRQSFRAMVGGQVTNWVDPAANVRLHFVEARTYRQGPLP